MSEYIGRRIVPVHAGVWSGSKSYEELTIVLHEDSGDSYISRRAVPAGTAITDETYWMLHSLYSQQIADAVAQMEETETRLKTVETRLDANVSASTDADADYAAEVVDARVDNNGNVYSSLGTAVRGQIEKCFQASNIIVSESNYESVLPDMDDAIPGMAYYITSATIKLIENSPITYTSSGGVLLTFNYSVSYGHGYAQMYISGANGSDTKVFFRREAVDGWSDWTGNEAAVPVITSSNYTDYVTENVFTTIKGSCFRISSNITSDMISGLPLYGVAAFVQKQYTNGSVYYVFYYMNGGIYLYYGGNFYNTGLHGYGVSYTGTSITDNVNGITGMDDLPTNVVYYISPSVTEEQFSGLPEYGYIGDLILFNYSNSIKNTTNGEVAILITTNGFWYNYKTSGVWRTWTKLKADEWEALEDGYFPVIQAFQSIGGIGDSLMAGYCYNKGNVVHSGTGRESKNNWIEYMCKRNGISCNNYAVGGSTFNTWRSTYFDSMGVADERCDAYIIALGVNDSNSEIGSMDDIDSDDYENNAESYYGSCHWLISKLNETFDTDIRIFLLTNPGRTASEQTSAAEENQALYDIAELFDNVLVVDLAEDFASKYYRSGLISKAYINGHYSPVAYAYMSKLIEYELNKYIIDSYDKFQGVPYSSTETYPNIG